MYDQLYIYINNFLNELLYAFPKAYSTQHALLLFLNCNNMATGTGKFVIHWNYAHGSVKSI